MDEQEITLITRLSWGSVEVTTGGQTFHFRDCKVWPGGTRDWNWRETGTEHSPGIQPTDVQEVLEKGVEVIVLGRGVQNRLEVQAETEALLKARGIQVHIESTPQAVELYNDLARQGRKVGGLFHTTC